jgi:hypothetical protein
MVRSVEMTDVTQQHELLPTTRNRAGFEVDYYDRFVATGAGLRGTTPKEVAEAVERAAGLGGVAIWKGVLQLRPWPADAPRHRSWAVVDSGDGWLTLGARSWALTARVVLELDGDRLSATTLLRYDNPVGRLIWTPLSAVHRHLMPGLLKNTVRVLAAREESLA